MYCRCGEYLFGKGLQGLCSECYPLSKALAVKEDAAVDAASQKNISIRSRTLNVEKNNIPCDLPRVRASVAEALAREYGDMKPLTEPLTKKQFLAQFNEFGIVRGVVVIYLDDLISVNLKGFLDLISTKLIGSDLLMDVAYYVCGYNSGEIHISVAGILPESDDFST